MKYGLAKPGLDRRTVQMIRSVARSAMWDAKRLTASEASFHREAMI